MPGLQVHIVPVGWEYDRAVEPFTLENSDPRRKHAHRVYLVVPGLEGDKGFTAKIEKTLKGTGIDVRRVIVDRYRGDQSIEFESTLAAVAGICHAEAYRGGNQVHVNISSGSKIGAFASGLAAMAYQQTGNVHIYYVQPEDYTANLDSPRREKEQTRTGLSYGLKHVLDLELMPLVQCTRPQLQVLAFLKKSGGRAKVNEVLLHLIAYPDGEMGDFIDLLPAEDAKGLGVRQSETATQRSAKKTPIKELRGLQSKALGRLRTLLRKLEHEGWIEYEPNQRQRTLRLTPPGQIFALLAQDESAQTAPSAKTAKKRVLT